MANAFDETDCPIPPVVRIPPDPMLPSDAIADAPDDIQDCDDPLMPMADPPPCPIIEVGHASLSFVTDRAFAGVRLEVVKSDCCDFELDLDIKIPDSACPVMTVDGGPRKDFIIYGATTAAEVGTGFLSVAKAEGCEFDFDIGIELGEVETECVAIAGPDTAIKVPFAGTSELGTFRLLVTKSEDGCAYDFDMEGNAPCPPITIGGEDELRIPVSYSSSSIGSVIFRVIRGPDCSFDFDMTMGLPCAPITTDGTLQSKAPVEIIPYSEGIPGRTEFTIVKGKHCDYDMDVNVTMGSPAMAAITTSSISARSSFTVGSGTVTLYRVIGTTLTAVRTITVFSNWSAAVPTGKHVQLVMIDGKPFVNGEDCVPA